MNPLVRLGSLGQSVWLDFIRRGMLESGALGRLIGEDGVRGVTSNPAIFEKAILETDDYREPVRKLLAMRRSPADIYRQLTVEDVRAAADLLRPVYDRLEGTDGFVSLEVSPHLARDTAGTVDEARRLWATVERPNLLVKVPGTREGLPAIRELIAEGVNVNVTLLFSLERYRQVAEAYLLGLEDRVARSRSLERVASVASFFLSRIDVVVDPLLERKSAEGGPAGKLAASLRGHVAVASAKAAYGIYRELQAGERFRRLAVRGARSQRLLWASTGTKNPAYSDVKYVEALIGPETIDTMPLETLEAYRDHGEPAPRLAEGSSEAAGVLARLGELDMDLGAVTRRLEEEGIAKFVKPYDRVMDELKARAMP